MREQELRCSPAGEPLWHTFEQDKKSIEDEFDNCQWDLDSGLSGEELKAACDKLVQENAHCSRMTIKAKLMAFIMENAQISVNPHDWFADRINHADIIETYRELWKDEANRLLGDVHTNSLIREESVVYRTQMDFSHTSPDWQAVMDLGIPGLLERIRKARKADEDEAQRDFYEAAELVYEAAIAFTERLAEKADSMKETYPKMGRLAQSLHNLAKGAPTTLLEAMELSTLYYTIQNDIEVTRMRTMGGLDQLYYRYYKADLAEGRYTEEQLREIMDYYLYRYYARKVISNIPFYLGGRDKDGKDMLNELSYLIVDEYRKLEIPDPKLQIKVHKDIPEDFIALLFTYIREGISSFCFVNDDVVVEGLKKLGESEEDARNYTVIGCYEPAAEGKEVPCTCGVYVNMAQVVNIAVHNGYDPMARRMVGTAGNAEDFESFEHFLAYWKRLLKEFIEESILVTNEREKRYIDINPCPFFSGSLAECVERGKDAYAGGAKYNNTSYPIYGVATAVDSLFAIKKVVFDEKILTFDEFAAVLADNWKDHEELRHMVLNSTPKFGNHDPAADALMVEIVSYATGLINKKPNGRGGIWRSAMFSITLHELHGEKTAATPDGRLAGEPISKNLCAVVGQDKLGPTALIDSVCELDFTETPGGAILDLVLHKTAAAGKEGLTAMIGLMKTYFAKGGFAIHLNVFDPEVLREAQKNPEKYSTLQVRLCGWNEYFVTLSKTLQDEFIAQTEHALGA